MPRPGWPNLQVVVTSALARLYRRRGRGDFVDRMAAQGLAARRLTGRRDVLMIRESLMRDFIKAGVQPTPDDRHLFSMWSGYRAQPSCASVERWLEQAGVRTRILHTSGHASPDDLRSFAAALKPATVVPIQGFNWDAEQHGFGHVTRLGDGESLDLS